MALLLKSGSRLIQFGWQIVSRFHHLPNHLVWHYSSNSAIVHSNTDWPILPGTTIYNLFRSYIYAYWHKGIGFTSISGVYVSPITKNLKSIHTMDNDKCKDITHFIDPQDITWRLKAGRTQEWPMDGKQSTMFSTSLKINLHSACWFIGNQWTASVRNNSLSNGKPFTCRSIEVFKEK